MFHQIGKASKKTKKKATKTKRRHKLAILFIILILVLCLARDGLHTMSKRTKNKKQTPHENETADRFKELTEFIELIDEDEEN